MFPKFPFTGKTRVFGETGMHDVKYHVQHVSRVFAPQFALSTASLKVKQMVMFFGVEHVAGYVAARTANEK
jgi:hypothetical protein